MIHHMSANALTIALLLWHFNLFDANGAILFSVVVAVVSVVVVAICWFNYPYSIHLEAKWAKKRIIVIFFLTHDNQTFLFSIPKDITCKFLESIRHSLTVMVCIFFIFLNFNGNSFLWIAKSEWDGETELIYIFHYLEKQRSFLFSFRSYRHK